MLKQHTQISLQTGSAELIAGQVICYIAIAVVLYEHTHTQEDAPQHMYG